jgi:hypothetical protein
VGEGGFIEILTFPFELMYSQDNTNPPLPAFFIDLKDQSWPLGRLSPLPISIGIGTHALTKEGVLAQVK